MRELKHNIGAAIEIPHSKPALDEKEVQAVSLVIRSGQLAQGPEVACFEEETGELLGVEHAIAVSSGSAALHLALLALGVGPGDEVIIPSYVCTAVMYAVQKVGAEPRLADIRNQDFNIDPHDAAQKITVKTKAIIVPHMFGTGADLDKIEKLGIPAIEDCALSFGAKYDGRPLGSFGSLSVTSFYATKMLTTGEGGMVFTRSPELADKIRDLREYADKSGNELYHNFKMSDLAAAMGRIQLKKLAGFITRRKELAELYHQYLSCLPIGLPRPVSGREHIFYRYVVRTPEPAKTYVQAFRMGGVVVEQPVFRPLHTYTGRDYCQVTEEAFHTALSLPIYPALSDEEGCRIAETAQTIFVQP